MRTNREHIMSAISFPYSPANGMAPLVVWVSIYFPTPGCESPYRLRTDRLIFEDGKSSRTQCLQREHIWNSHLILYKCNCRLNSRTILRRMDGVSVVNMSTQLRTTPDISVCLLFLRLCSNLHARQFNTNDQMTIMMESIREVKVSTCGKDSDGSGIVREWSRFFSKTVIHPGDALQQRAESLH